MSIQLKPIIAALGLGLATLSGSAAAVTLYSPVTAFEDNDVDFIINGAGSDPTKLDVGDTLVAFLTIDQTLDVFGTGKSPIAPAELSGVAAITLMGFGTLDGVGVMNDMIFGPSALGLNTYLSQNVTGGAAGGGAMVAFFLDNKPTLANELITTGSTNCTSFADCISRASNGTVFEVDGFTGKADATQPDGWANGDADEFWVALNAEADLAGVLAAPLSSKFGAVNYGLSILDDGGNPFIKQGVSCTGTAALLCQGDDKVDMIGSGDVLGGQGLSALIAGDFTAPGTKDGAAAHSDFDFQKAVPEPASLALLGIGLLGMGASLRRRVR